MSIAAEGKPRGGRGGKGVKSELNTCAETWLGWGGSVGPAASVRIHTAAAMLRGGEPAVVVSDGSAEAGIINDT